MEKTEKSCDILVIGGGGAGFCAAMRAAQLGKKVILLEKAPAIGGSAAMARGIGAVGAKAQLADPDTDFTGAQMLKDWMEQTNYLANYPLIYTFLKNSGETVDWLQELGCRMEFVGNVQQKHADSPFRTYFIWDTWKAGEMRKLISLVKETGGEVLTRTWSEELITENGRVTGAWAKTGEKRFPIYADAVILCTGGYGNNQDMVMQSTRGARSNSISTGTQTGDGILMGIAAGCDTENLEAIEFHGCDIPSEKVRQSKIGPHGMQINKLCELPCGVWVNHGGYRFVNEEVGEDTSFIGNVTHHQGSEYFVLLDSYMMDTLAEKGSAALGIARPIREKDPGEPWEKLKEQLAQMLEIAAVYEGETLREVAGKAGVSADAFVQTVAEYNRFCENGFDEMYGKDASLLTPIIHAPYYLVEGRANYLCTLGGLRIDPSMRVLKKDLTPMPGLYAAGCDASGGLVNNAYVSYEGVTIGWACTSGRLAAEEAVRNLESGK